MERKGAEEGGEMANLLTCEQLNEDWCPCQSVVSLSLGGVYMSVSEDDVNPESLSISSLLSLFNRSVILWRWQRCVRVKRVCVCVYGGGGCQWPLIS